jgi:hypothetical protein
MHALRTILLSTLVICAVGCQHDDDDGLPSVQFQGRFLSYAADRDIVVCDGTVPLTEAWIEAVARYLGIDPEQILPTTYYFVDSPLLEEMCSKSAGGCIDRVDGRLGIFSTRPLDDHELVHAIHFSAWPRRQPLLQEGLASAFVQDTPPQLYYSFTPDQIDAAIEAESASPEHNVYLIGQYLVYYMLTRYGPEAFEQFWHATSRPTTAAAFRAAFQDSFGESLDEMLADVDIYGGPMCAIPICVGEPLAWEQGTWRTESPSSCADGAVVGFTGERSDLVRNELVEITQADSYDVSVSESTEVRQGAMVMSCNNGCDQWVIYDGESYAIDLAPGLYRVTTVSDLDGPGVSVEIRPSN